jgi:hypothetical protein
MSLYRSLLSSFYAMACVLMFLLFGGAKNIDTAMDKGLTAFYLCSGNGLDGSGHKHHGTAIGVTPTADRFGHAGDALYFSGKSKIIIPGNIFRSQAYTFTLWVKPTLYPASVEQFSIFALGDDTGRAQGIALSNHYSGIDHLGFSAASARLGTRKILILTSHQLAPLNQWYHLAMTNGADSFSFYVNGTLIDNESCGGTLPFFGDPTQLSLGFRPNMNSPFTGVLDDVRIYDRVLSAEEVNEFYKIESTSLANP